MPEPDEKIILPLKSIAWALLVVRSAHRLLNAVLDGKPKAAIVRELAVELDEFVVKSMTLQYLDTDTDADSFDQVFDMLTSRHYTVRLDDGNLIVEPSAPPVEMRIGDL